MLSDYYKVDQSSPSGLVSVRTGKSVGTLSRMGYWIVQTRRLGSKRAHRVIWELTNGPIPHGMQIDHIDRNPSNNTLSNLRLVTAAENTWNTGSHYDSKTGVRCVIHHQNGYRIQVKRGNAYMRTTRPTLEEAIAVRDLMLEGLYV